MNDLVAEGEGVVERLHTRSLNVRNQLKLLATGSYSGTDLGIRIERLKQQAGETFRYEESVMVEYHHSPLQHLGEHEYFIRLLAYIAQNPSKAALCGVYNKMVEHAKYHDDCFANHFEELSLRRV